MRNCVVNCGGFNEVFIPNHSIIAGTEPPPPSFATWRNIPAKCSIFNHVIGRRSCPFSEFCLFRKLTNLQSSQKLHYARSFTSALGLETALLMNCLESDRLAWWNIAAVLILFAAYANILPIHFPLGVPFALCLHSPAQSLTHKKISTFLTLWLE